MKRISTPLFIILAGLWLMNMATEKADLIPFSPVGTWRSDNGDETFEYQFANDGTYKFVLLPSPSAPLDSDSEATWKADPYWSPDGEAHLWLGDIELTVTTPSAPQFKIGDLTYIFIKE